MPAAASSLHPCQWHPSHGPAHLPSSFRAVLSPFQKAFSPYMLWPRLWTHAHLHTRSQQASVTQRFGGFHLAATKTTHPSHTGKWNGAGWFLQWCWMVPAFSRPGGAMVLFGDEGEWTGTGPREFWQWTGWTQQIQPEIPPQKWEWFPRDSAGKTGCI